MSKHPIMSKQPIQVVDDPVILSAVSDMLVFEGYEVATNVLDGLQVLERRRPGPIMLGMWMLSPVLTARAEGPTIAGLN